MNIRLTTNMTDANGLQRAIRPTGFFQHQENGRRFLQLAMHNGQYWVFKETLSCQNPKFVFLIFMLYHQMPLKIQIKAVLYLNAIFTPPNMGLMKISRSRFKQSKGASLITRIYVMGNFVNFLVIFGCIYIWVETIFLKGLVRFREIRKSEDLMKFKNWNL